MDEGSGYCGSDGGIESVLADRLGIMGLVVGRERERG